MSPRLSTYLDAMRALAAIIVLLSHFAYARFTDGYYLIIRELNLGSDAVVVFFVLSGFVIAYTAENRDRAIGRYFFQRATRIYSVAIPAIILTLLFDRIGASISPGAYDGWWYNPAPALLSLFHGLTFSSEWGPFGFRLGTNGPYWSLSYEVAYYILFGFAFFLSGYRRVLLLGSVIVIFGIKVLALAPAWLLGVVAYRALRNEIQISKSVSWAATIAPILLYMAMLGLQTPVNLMAITTAMLGSDVVTALRFSNEFIWNGAVATLVTAHLFGVGSLVRDNKKPIPFESKIKWMAAASFSIYLLHYPTLQLVDALLASSPIDLYLRHLILLIATVVVCLIFAQIFERPLPAFRRAVLRLFSRSYRAKRAT